MTKKIAAKKVSKVSAPVAKTSIPVGGPKVNKYKLVSFSVTTVIPVQSYGDIRPTITIETASIDDARAIVMPHIEQLWETYAEAPRDGSKRPAFLGKITETVKVVTPTASVTPEEEKTPVTKQAKEVAAPVAKEEVEKSPAVLKAEKAISLAMTKDATVAIEEQIKKSVKINDEDKPALFVLVLKKRKELN